EDASGDAGEEGGDDEGPDLVAGRVDAHGLGGDLVLADGEEGAAVAALLEAEGDEDGEEGEEPGPEEAGVEGQAGEAQSPAEVAGELPERRLRDLLRVVEGLVGLLDEDADDLAEAEGDDGEIVAPEA